MNKNQNNK